MKEPVKFWSKEKAEWYIKALSVSNYQERVIEKIEPLIKPGDSVLDIGAGVGTFSVPLAKIVKSVTALEPSPAMLKELKEYAKREKVKNIEHLPETFEKAALNLHDVVLVANTPVVKDIKRLEKVMKKSKRLVILVMSQKEEDKFFFKKLYPLIFDKEYFPKKGVGEFIEILEKSGFKYSTEDVEYNFDQPFDDLDEAVRFWKEYLETDNKEKILHEFLKKRLEKVDKGLIYRLKPRGKIIWLYK